jgi:hypothetical protein
VSHTIEEQLSALLDGQLPVAEEELLMRRLDRDPSCRETLARYSLIGECLRGSLVGPGVIGISDRVRDAIGGEKNHTAVSSGRDGAFARRAVAGFGIAAAVAVLALTSLSGLVNGPEISDVRRPAENSANVAPDSIANFSYKMRSGSARRAVIAPARLTGYLVSHGEYANSLSRQVMDSYVVSQTADSLIWEAPEVTIDD